MRHWITIDDLRTAARRRIPRFVFDFLEGGAGEGAGVTRSRKRLDTIELVPRYLTGQSRTSIDTSVEILGRRYAQPFGIAPTGMNGLIWPQADQMLAAAAREADIPMVNSTTASASIEDVAAIAGSNAWFQLYAFTEDAVNEDIVRRAEGTGVDVFVMTVDTSSVPNRNRDARNNFGSSYKVDANKLLQMALRPSWLLASGRHGPPVLRNFAPYAEPGSKGTPMLRAAGRLIKAHANWEDLRKLRDRWHGKLVVKGLMAEEDAAHAVEIGCDAVWVSNHGGRQLESAPAPIDRLAPIVRAIGRRAATFVDGGFMTGEDVIKANALGADMVFLGRGPLYGLAAGGRAGLTRALDIYRADVARTLLQLGHGSIASLREAGSTACRAGEAV